MLDGVFFDDLDVFVRYLSLGPEIDYEASESLTTTQQLSVDLCEFPLPFGVNFNQFWGNICSCSRRQQSNTMWDVCACWGSSWDLNNFYFKLHCIWSRVLKNVTMVLKHLILYVIISFKLKWMCMYEFISVTVCLNKTVVFCLQLWFIRQHWFALMLVFQSVLQPTTK